ncbi:MAG: GNAT family N-acetyltransferase [Spirochaetota bacterium]
MKDLTIATQRTDLIPFSQNEETLFLSLNQDEFIRKYMWDDEIISQQMSKDILAQNESLFTQDRYGIWKIEKRDSKEIIGYVGLWYFFAEKQPQLIYALLEAFTGRGYATEVSQAILDYTFEKLKFNYLIAATDEPHIASQKVAERLGMSFQEKRIENGKPTLFYKITKSK